MRQAIQGWELVIPNRKESDCNLIHIYLGVSFITYDRTFLGRHAYNWALRSTNFCTCVPLKTAAPNQSGQLALEESCACKAQSTQFAVLQGRLLHLGAEWTEPSTHALKVGACALGSECSVCSTQRQGRLLHLGAQWIEPSAMLQNSEHLHWTQMQLEKCQAPPACHPPSMHHPVQSASATPPCETKVHARLMFFWSDSCFCSVWEETAECCQLSCLALSFYAT